MHRNSNITGNLNSTFLAAGIFDFGHLQHIDFQRLFYYKNTPSFTGKEKDSETGFYYFGARYYDPSLSGLFLSVDPMADKYPSISPYAYCVWNPVKLVDPDGKEIDISILSQDNQDRLINCLSKLTGLSLYVKGGKLRYNYSNGNERYSSKARQDLINAIDDENILIAVAECSENTSSRTKGIFTGYRYDIKQGIEVSYDASVGLDFNMDQDDFSTFGLSMSFMHELLHCHKGYMDPTDTENNNTFQDVALGGVLITMPIEMTESYKNGVSVVGRVNEYRHEMGWDTRMTYAEHSVKGVPFRRTDGSCYWIKRKKMKQNES